MKYRALLGLAGILSATMTPVAEGAWPATLSVDDFDGAVTGGEFGKLGSSVRILSNPGVVNCDGQGEADVVSDFNGDGLQDVAVGAPFASTSGEEEGAVYVYFGRERWQNDLTPDAADVQIIGNLDFQGVGASIASGDVNADCVSDLILGVSEANNGAGALYIFFGAASWNDGSSSLTIGDADVVISGETSGDELGLSVDAGYDIDGDGLGDMIVGAPGSDGDGSSLDSAGRVYVVPGRASWSSSLVISTAASTGFYGNLRFGELGTQVAFVPDFNDQGKVDFMASAPRSSVSGSSLAGRVFLATGEGFSSWGTSEAIDMVSGVEFQGAASSNLAGQKVASLGDVNMDGVSDVLIGAPGVSSGAGASYLFLGSAGASGSRSVSDADASFVGGGAQVEASHVGAAGDLNADGMADFSVAASGAQGTALSSTLYVFYGRSSGLGSLSLADADITVTASEVGYHFGEALSGGADVDGDGLDDLFVGAPGGIASGQPVEGHAYIVRSGLFDDRDADGVSPYEGDCNDLDASINPDASEIICDDIDQDCDGTDFGDSDGDGFDGCSGLDAGVWDCDDEDPFINPGIQEQCDGADEDCDGQVDEDSEGTFYADGDGDGYGVDSDTKEACGAPPGYVELPGDCDDENDQAYPGGEEVCDSEDNDCDGSVDEGVQQVFFVDDDGDGFGAEEAAPACNVAPGQSEVGGDCDDSLSEVNPDATELCGDDIDNDCSGTSDDRDMDEDGFVDAGCSAYVGENSGDCNDGNALVNPGQPEVCDDGIDNDCTGFDNDVDVDEDSDGYVTIYCGGTDCDDSDPLVNPNQPEICDDGKDNDCSRTDTDAGIDDLDADGDGALSPACNGTDCDDIDADRYPGAEDIAYDGIDQDCDGSDVTDLDGDGYPSINVSGGTDCNDNDPGINPGVEEEPYDGVDQDCDGEDLSDIDGDGFSFSEDCDDEDETIYPEADEVLCDGIDQDCDGVDFTDADEDGYSACGDGPVDCDDNNADVNAGVGEIAYDGIDQDCDGYDLADVDGDGYCLNSVSLLAVRNANGWTGTYDYDDAACPLGVNDCDDDAEDRNPDAYEDPYDGVDNDCNAQVDDPDPCVDHDDDGYLGQGCDEQRPDCDILNGDVFPAGYEDISNGIDDDCDGLIDEPDGTAVAVYEGCGSCSSGASAPGTSAGSLALLMAGVLLRRRRQGL